MCNVYGQFCLYSVTLQHELSQDTLQIKLVLNHTPQFIGTH